MVEDALRWHCTHVTLTQVLTLADTEIILMNKPWIVSFVLKTIGPSEVCRSNLGRPLFLVIGPSEVRATSEAT